MNLPANPTVGRNRYAWLWLLLVLAVVTVIRLRLLNMPLERDEGEFAYGGQLMMHGVSIYKEAYNDALKLPGTCAAYALTMILFGQTTTAIHAATILVTLATAIFVFFIARRICGDGAGIVAAGTYALLAINPQSSGLAAHATHFVMLPAMAGILLLQSLNQKTSAARIFFAGLLLGIAIVMKQTGAVFGIFAVIWVTYGEWISTEKSWRRLASRWGWLALGGLLPFGLTCALIASAGDLPQFWLWTFKYAGAHAAVLTLAQTLGEAADVAGQLFVASPGLWLLAFAGIILLFYEPSLRQWRFFILSFVLFSAAAVSPGWRPHYFIQFFPAAGLLAGVAFHALWPLPERLKMSLSPGTLLLPIFFVALASPLLQWYDVYFTLTPAQVSRTIYGTNPFPEAVEVGRYLAEHCPPDGRVAILGSEPEIYFYSRRHAATSYISMYPLMEPQPYAAAMQQEMINQIEKANPDYVIFVHVSGSWLQNPKSNTLIFDWFDQYRQDHLRPVGLVEIASPTAYHWFSGDNTAVQTSSDFWLAIFQKR
ncbi:MAG TPA: glycosyltransferase family 39 protein [Pseudomonadales bacterium]|nr:glycosyltransferase family 39 protein [Pseudomonadales bacterium]